MSRLVEAIQSVSTVHWTVFGMKVRLTEVTEAIAEQDYSPDSPVHLGGVGRVTEGGDQVEDKRRQEDEQD